MERQNINANSNRQNLHSEALRVLMSIQYYMSTLSYNNNEVTRNLNYQRCLEVMGQAVETLIRTVKITEKKKTLDQAASTDYPEELLLVINKITNINRRLEFIENTPSSLSMEMTLSEK